MDIENMFKVKDAVDNFLCITDNIVEHLNGFSSYLRPSYIVQFRNKCRRRRLHLAQNAFCETTEDLLGEV